PDNLYYGHGGIQVDFNTGAALHVYKPGAVPLIDTADGPVLTVGQTYDIEFGLLEVDEETVRVYLTIDGEQRFKDVVVKDAEFINKPLYFGIFACWATATISKPDAK
ncbi:MAG: hypothetical protein U0O42_10840, partial [Oscillospiraceae bacterium]